MRKRLLCLLAAVVVLCGLAATAQGGAELQAMVGAGQCGENITWNLDAAGKLTITGTGDFYGEDSENYLPWRYFSRYIVEANISDGITSVPDMAFHGCDYLESVTLGKDVRSFGSDSFAECNRLTDISGADSLEFIAVVRFPVCITLELPSSGTKSGAAAQIICGITRRRFSLNAQDRRTPCL